jgi:hypothetical protein
MGLQPGTGSPESRFQIRHRFHAGGVVCSGVTNDLSPIIACNSLN